MKRSGMLCAVILPVLFSSLALVDPSFSAGTTGKKATPVFMWSIEGPKARAFIFGSIHVFSKGLYPLDSRIEKAFKSCPRIVFEADANGMGAKEIRDMMLRLGTYKPGKTLKDEISPETYTLLRKRVEALNLDMTRFDRFRPWLASVSIASAQLGRLGYTSANSMDAYFAGKARKDGKEMIFFESARAQIELLSKAFPGHEEDILKQSLDELDVLRTSRNDIERAWKTGDAERVEAYTRKSLKGYPDIEKKLFIERNKAWAERIAGLLSQEGSVFVMVGSGHLVGKDGVLELLKSRGLEPVQE